MNQIVFLQENGIQQMIEAAFISLFYLFKCWDSLISEGNCAAPVSLFIELMGLGTLKTFQWKYSAPALLSEAGKTQ